MKITYDVVEKALYIAFGNGLVKRASELSQDVFVDYGEDNKLIGIELVNVEKKDLEGLI